MKREVEEIKESEALEKDEAAVCRLLADLEHVDAPDNFERWVMAKIADGPQPSRRVFGLPLAIAYSLPLLLVVVIAVGYMLNLRNSSPAPSLGPTVAANTAPPIRESIAPPAVNNGSGEPNNSVVATSNTSVPKDPEGQTASRAAITPQRKKDKKPSGGYFDRTVVERKPITPLGMGNQNSSVNPDEIITSSSLPVHEVLSEIGIKAEYKGGWIVRSIVPNSIASRSDARIGDVVISLDNTVLSADTGFKGKFVVSSIRVRRNGQELDLPLK